MGWYIWPADDPLGEPPCRFCGMPIRVDSKFYFEENKQFSHAGCAWKHEEERRKALLTS
jgi:hypothetical protein